MTMIHPDKSPAQASDEERQAVFTIPRPAWADELHVGQDLNGVVVTHLWTAPTVATGGIFAGEASGNLQVYVQQLDDLVVDEGVVTYAAGQPVVFLTEADIELSTTEARRYAAAIVEACDRLDVTRDGQS